MLKVLTKFLVILGLLFVIVCFGLIGLCLLVVWVNLIAADFVLINSVALICLVLSCLIIALFDCCFGFVYGVVCHVLLFCAVNFV